MGFVFLLLWPLLGLVTFFAAAVWYTVRRSRPMGFGRLCLIWLGIALGLSFMMAILEKTRLFILPNANWPDYVYFGPIMIWPVPAAIVMARLIVLTVKRAAR